LGQRTQDLFERSLPYPSLEATMARLVRRIPGRQIFPSGSASKDPEDPVQDISWIAPGATLPIPSQPRFGQKWSQDFPLLVGQLHINKKPQPTSLRDIFDEES
jgi:hypothetical protein